MKTNTRNRFLLFTVMAISAHYASSGEEPTNRADSKLKVTTYAPGSDPAQFSWPTHLAFGPGNQEIVTELENSRFLFRDSAGDPFQISPVALRGPHSVVYNPTDELYYANDTG